MQILRKGIVKCMEDEIFPVTLFVFYFIEY